MQLEDRVQYLNFLVKTYNQQSKAIAATKQRLKALPGARRDEAFDPLLRGEDKAEGMNIVKDRIKREIKKELANFDIWPLWLENVPGLGPWMAAEFIILFNYRFLPICKECGGDLVKVKAKSGDGNVLVCSICNKQAKRSAKGADDGGLLKYKLDLKDFPTISKWWSYMGREVIDGKLPKRKSGEQANWSSHGRMIGWQFSEQVNRQKDKTPYGKLLLEFKRKRQKKSPDWTPGHILNASKHEVVKIFLAHFWTVQRVLNGMPISLPYAHKILGHSNIIEPPHMSEDLKELYEEAKQHGYYVEIAA